MTQDARPQTLDNVCPTKEEQEEHGLVLRNGVDLQLGRQDPLIRIAERVAQKYPHHLALIQSGNFLHAYNKSAYFLHKLKNYQLRVVGTEAHPAIRCGLPVSGHKRRLWKVCQDFGVPYLVALGTKGNYQLHINNETIETSLIDEIPDNIVIKLIEDLSQTDRLHTAKAVQMLLKPEQITFRLKRVGNDLYQTLHRDLERFPTSHRHFIGRDIADCLGRIIRGIYAYSMTDQRHTILRHLSADIDMLKMLLQTIHQIHLIDMQKYSLRAALLIESGNLVGGLLAKITKASPQAVVQPV